MYIVINDDDDKIYKKYREKKKKEIYLIKIIVDINQLFVWTEYICLRSEQKDFMIE